jgi:hypothetical protein
MQVDLTAGGTATTKVRITRANSTAARETLRSMRITVTVFARCGDMTRSSNIHVGSASSTMVFLTARVSRAAGVS